MNREDSQSNDPGFAPACPLQSLRASAISLMLRKDQAHEVGRSQSATTFVGLSLPFGPASVRASSQKIGRRADQRRGAWRREFEVDPMWPKPLPNGWYLGQTIGVGVDANDHVWIIHRSDSLDAAEAAADEGTGAAARRRRRSWSSISRATCCGSWGGKDGDGYQWPASNHGLQIDGKGNIWIGGNGGANDGHILKFTQDGKFLMQVGIKKAGLGRRQQLAGSLLPRRQGLDRQQEQRGLSSPTATATSASSSSTWTPASSSATGARTATSRTMRPRRRRRATRRARRRRSSSAGRCTAPTCRWTASSTSATARAIGCRCSRAKASSCKEIFVEPDSLGDGSTWDVAFSKDAQQKYLYLADGRNQKLHIYDRQSLTELTNFGEGGHYPGQFYSMHSIAVDSKGNLYTTETYQGRRVQKFLYKGLAPVTKKEQGTVWPTR